ncbi:MAG TPA: alcohol dehydrogenase catalytic domain-containing protein, partial [Armatimonadota bacterium]|nr:alcohol dehydrogenase catalytic domain-containing protein [Armatimonadota bacterium]
MSDVLQRYRAVEYSLPTDQRSWFLYGAGMENLGKDKQPVPNTVPTCGPDELLVRCDATGLCFSDIKIIKQGGDHIRIKRDLAKEPAIMGHESVVSVVKVGENLTGQFSVGQRFVVQADIYVNGVGKAYGYAQPGAMTQYETMGQDVLNGDEGCYLIPIKEETGYAQAALTEPWACVVHSYVLSYRQSIKDGGTCLMVGGDGADALTLGTTFANAVPSRIVAANLPANLLTAIKATGAEIIEVGCGGQCGGLDTLVEANTNGAGFDDIIVCGKVNDDCLEKLATKLSHGGLFNIVCNKPTEREISVDVGCIHYDDWYYIGTSGTDISAAYGSHRTRTELKAGGTAWLLGAGGPMGQMHVQRACEMPNGPKLIVATDIDPARLQELRERFIPAAEAHDRTLIVLNPQDFTPEAFNAKLSELNGGRGFDDVVALVPVPVLIKQAAG